MIRAYLAIGLLSALIGSHWYAYSAGVSREHDRNVAAASAQKDKVQAAIDLRDQSASDTRITMLDVLGVTLPRTEAAAHATVTQVRTIYRDRVIAGDCSPVWPDGMQQTLGAARERAIAARSGVRP